MPVSVTKMIYLAVKGGLVEKHIHIPQSKVKRY